MTEIVKDEQTTAEMLAEIERLQARVFGKIKRERTLESLQKVLDEVRAEYGKDFNEDKLTTFIQDYVSSLLAGDESRSKAVKFYKNKCNAHLYERQWQGKRIILRCIRPNCHHYATLDDINHRQSECFVCGKHFEVKDSDLFRDPTRKDVEGMLKKKLDCGCVSSLF